MKFTIPTLAVAALTLGGHGVSTAQQPHDLFQQALVLETVRGDLPAALALYEQILRDHPDDRPLRANTLARLGHGFELLGRPEARQVWQQLVREHPDQVNLAGLARSRVAALAGPAADPTYRLLLADAQDDGRRRPAQFAFSPDGSSFVFRIRPDANSRMAELRPSAPALYVGHRDGRLPRLLWSSADPAAGSPVLPRWSPDGRQIAFVVREGGPEVENPPAVLYVMPAGGGTPQRIGEPVTSRLWDLSWTADGRLAWVTGGGIRVRSLDGATTDLVNGINSRSILGGFSPDGRWVALVQPQDDLIQHESAVWVVNVASGAKVQVTRGPGPHGSPSWGRDGTLYYVAGGNGAANVWQVRINPQTGEAAGPPTQVTFYLDASVGQLARAGSGLGFTLIRSTPTIYRAETSAPQRPTPVARGGQPVLSPDGSTVYFVRARPHAEENGPVALHAVTPADGAIRTLADNVLATSGSGLPGYDLSTDGRTIAYTGADQSGHAIFTVSTSGGSPRVIARLEDNGEITPRFSPDGSQIGYADGKNLYLASTTGGAPRQIARLEAGFEGWSLRWSPNGRQIAVFGYPGATSAGNNVAFVLSADGTGGLRQVGTLDDYKESLQWDPAGARLIYHLSRRNSSTVQIPAAGGSESLFHDAPGVWDYRGIWAPDGRAYFFEVAPDNSPTWEVWRLDARSGSSARFAGNGPSLPSFSRDGRMMTWREAPTVGELWLIDNLP